MRLLRHKAIFWVLLLAFSCSSIGDYSFASPSFLSLATNGEGEGKGTPLFNSISTSIMDSPMLSGMEIGAVSRFRNKEGGNGALFGSINAGSDPLVEDVVEILTSRLQEEKGREGIEGLSRQLGIFDMFDQEQGSHSGGLGSNSGLIGNLGLGGNSGLIGNLGLGGNEGLVEKFVCSNDSSMFAAGVNATLELFKIILDTQIERFQGSADSLLMFASDLVKIMKFGDGVGMVPALRNAFAELLKSDSSGILNEGIFGHFFNKGNSTDGNVTRRLGLMDNVLNQGNEKGIGGVLSKITLLSNLPDSLLSSPGFLSNLQNETDRGLVMDLIAMILDVTRSVIDGGLGGVVGSTLDRFQGILGDVLDGKNGTGILGIDLFENGIHLGFLNQGEGSSTARRLAVANGNLGSTVPNERQENPEGKRLKRVLLGEGIFKRDPSADRSKPLFSFDGLFGSFRSPEKNDAFLGGLFGGLFSNPEDGWDIPQIDGLLPGEHKLDECGNLVLDAINITMEFINESVGDAASVLNELYGNMTDRLKEILNQTNHANESEDSLYHKIQNLLDLNIINYSALLDGVILDGNLFYTDIIENLFNQSLSWNPRRLEVGDLNVKKCTKAVISAVNTTMGSVNDLLAESRAAMQQWIGNLTDALNETITKITNNETGDIFQGDLKQRLENITEKFNIFDELFNKSSSSEETPGSADGSKFAPDPNFMRLLQQQDPAIQAVSSNGTIADIVDDVKDCLNSLHATANESVQLIDYVANRSITVVVGVVDNFQNFINDTLDSFKVNGGSGLGHKFRSGLSDLIDNAVTDTIDAVVNMDLLSDVFPNFSNGKQSKLGSSKLFDDAGNRTICHVPMFNIFNSTLETVGNISNQTFTIFEKTLQNVASFLEPALRIADLNDDVSVVDALQDAMDAYFDLNITRQTVGGVIVPNFK